MTESPVICCFLEADVSIDGGDVDLKEISYELLTEAEKLKKRMNGSLVGIAITGKGLSEHALHQINAYPLDCLFLVRYDGNACLLNRYDLLFRNRLGLAGPFVALVGHTAEGTSIAGNIVAALDAAYLSNNVEVDYSDPVFEVTRPALQGQVYCRYKVGFHRPVVFSMKPGSIGYLKNDKDGIFERIQECDLTRGNGSGAREIGIVKGDHARIDLTEADVVVGIGKGVVDSGCLDEVRVFADRIKAACGCTRPLVDLGLFPMSKQIGVTGNIISPKVYLAFGISGTDHHTKGIRDARNIIAVNTDRNAPIFRVADVGFVGDLRKLIPYVNERFHTICADAR